MSSSIPKPQSSSTLKPAAELARASGVRFPNESAEYRRAREALLAEEIERAQPLQAALEVRLLLLGAALARLLSDLPGTPRVPFVAVQHNSKGWMPALATWLQSTSGRPVKVATEGEALRPGTFYLAPDDVHLGVDPSGHARFGREGPIGGFRPSATFLFDSVAKSYGPHALAVILTGMGSDGTAGLRGMHERGARVIAQDEESSVVFGMPAEAIRLGGADHVLPPGRIVALLLDELRQLAA